MSHDRKDFAILVLSCDAYKDLWRTYFDFFFKYWPDCPYKIYLGTNFEKFDYPRVTQVFSKTNSNWSDELKHILDQIPESHILLTLEDYFIYETVDTDEIQRYFEIAVKTEAAFLRLAIFPEMYKSLHQTTALEPFDDIGIIAKNSKYRINLQIAIWEKKSLSALIVEQESPWEFELNGSRRSDNMSKVFLSVLSDQKNKVVYGPIRYFCGAITQGKWMKDAIELCHENNIAVDTSHRPIETGREERFRYWYTRTPLIFRPILSKLEGKLKGHKAS